MPDPKEEKKESSEAEEEFKKEAVAKEKGLEEEENEETEEKKPETATPVKIEVEEQKDDDETEESEKDTASEEIEEIEENSETDSDSESEVILNDKTPQGTKKVFNKKTLAIFLIVLGTLALIGGGIFIYQKAVKKQSEETGIKEVEVIPTSAAEEPAEAPEQVEEIEVDRAELKIKVLNGRGEVGVAGEAQKFLEESGYENVATGNADNYDYEETVIAIKEDKENFLAILKDDLSDNYQVSERIDSLDDDDDFDAVITIGAK